MARLSVRDRLALVMACSAYRDGFKRGADMTKAQRRNRMMQDPVYERHYKCGFLDGRLAVTTGEDTYRGQVIAAMTPKKQPGAPPSAGDPE